LEDWRQIIPVNEQRDFFAKLEEHLNRFSKRAGTLELTIPMVCIEGEK
jgi:hypothetical protein